ncbi:hypothetical protein C5167_002828 [Papaver somniferum]|uniref:Carbonic anhydrase n=1 Tax=Papaver somniferum TaxID=3469 RepID=A0A4Y7L2G0_PAPSO|nr:alpha carbonic anhydrase 1, chloroplastic-like [Papaver somniferum]RZC78618.1 hypothetical protein C5167_002828 [Papaver somniferum]
MEKTMKFDLKTIFFPALIAVLCAATLTEQTFPWKFDFDLDFGSRINPSIPSTPSTPSTPSGSRGWAGHLNFSYSGAMGPDKWGILNPAFRTCANGKAQSPINIVTKDCVSNTKLGPLVREFSSTSGTLINNGYNIGLEYSNGCGSAMLDGKKFTLKSMHWHSPSEHTIDGTRFPLELHLVHASAQGSISVVSILYQYGKPDPILTELKSTIDQLEGIQCAPTEEVYLPVGVLKSKFLNPQTRKYYRYIGSLTVPPCHENIIWNILGTVRQVSKEQVDAIKAPLAGTCKDNSRPTQPLNGRKVVLYDEHKPEDIEN